MKLSNIKNLILCACILTPLNLKGDDDAVLAELKKINDRLDKIEARLDGQPILSATSTPSSEERGARGSFYIVEKLSINKYAIPGGEPDWSMIVDSNIFGPDHLQQKADYSRGTQGVAVWEGQLLFEEGKYEFAFSFNKYNAPGRTPYKATFFLTSKVDKTSFSLEAYSLGGPEKAKTQSRTLTKGIYDIKMVGCTSGGTANLSLILRFRKAGGEWTQLSPDMLVPPLEAK